MVKFFEQFVQTVSRPENVKESKMVTTGMHTELGSENWLDGFFNFKGEGEGYLTRPSVLSD